MSIAQVRPAKRFPLKAYDRISAGRYIAMSALSAGDWLRKEELGIGLVSGGKGTVDAR